MTILTAMQDVADLTSLARPISISSADETTRRLLATVHQTGDEIARRGDWARMLASATATDGPIALPADFRRLVPGGALSSTNGEPIKGPLSSDQWAALASLGATSRTFFTVSGTSILLNRAIAGGETITVNYVSKHWLVASDGTTKRARAGADTDAPLFDETLLVKGAIWRYRRDRGLPGWQDVMSEWEADLAAELRNDRGVTT